MSDTTTIARPYARAIFEYAHAAKQLPEWSVILSDLSQAVLNEEAKSFIDSPSSTPELQTQLLLSLFAKAKQSDQMKAIENLINLLAHYKRLLLLPDIYAQYEVLRAEQEKTLIAQITCFAALTDAQQQNLIKSLSKRLQRQITLDVSIDQSLLGGAVIRAGDLVIDGSVRGKLNKLGTNLAA